MQSQTLGPCTIAGKFVRLEPLRHEHIDRLAQAAAKLDWSLMLYPLLSREDVERRIISVIEKEPGDEEYAFAVLLKAENMLVAAPIILQYLLDTRGPR